MKTYSYKFIVKDHVVIVHLFLTLDHQSVTVGPYHSIIGANICCFIVYVQLIVSDLADEGVLLEIQGES